MDKEWNYSYLVQLFLELRGRGLSLSSADLEIVQLWKKEGINPDFAADVMQEMAREYAQLGRVFPATIAPVARRVKQSLKQRHEF